MKKQEIMALVRIYGSQEYAGELGKAANTRAAIEAALPDVPTVPEGQHRYQLELPDGDTRTARVAWVDRKTEDGVTTHSLCISVSKPSEPPKLTEEQHVAAVKVLLRANGLDGLPQRMLDAMLSAAPEPAQAEQPKAGEVVITTNQAGQCVAVTRQDDEGQILSVLWELEQAEQPRNEPVQQEPVLFVSPEQLNGFKDPEEGDLVDASLKPFGRYIPARKTPAGKFTQPLYTSPQAQPMSDEQIKELEEMNAQLREQNNMVSQACADLERQLEQARSVVNSASALVEAKGLNLHASMVAFTNLEAAIKESK